MHSLDFNQFTQANKDGMLVADLSELGFTTFFTWPIELKNFPVRDKYTMFRFVDRDMDTDNDVAGWLYQSDAGQKMLIINDNESEEDT